MVVGVELPIVARLGVASGAIERRVQLGQLIRRREGHAVNQRADRALIESDIYGNDHRTIGDGRRRRVCSITEHDVIHVKGGRETGVLNLKPETIEICCVGHAQGGKRNCFLPPGIDRQW